MSKIPALLVAGGGGTTVALGGAYLIKNGLGQNETPEVSLLFDSVGTFEQEWKDEKSKCVHGFFEGGFDANDERTSAPGNLNGASAFFSTTTTDQTPYKSCVIIDWKRNDYENSKWKDGKFTWTWTFVKGNEGFVNFNVAETISDSTNKLKFTGVFYLVGKEGASGSKWKVKHKKEVKDDASKKEIEATQIDNYFPKKGTGVTEVELSDSYWGFFKNNASGQQLQSICGNNDCTDTNKGPASSKRIDLSWSGIPSPADSDTNTLKDWSENLTWWDNIYGATPWSLKDKIGTFKGNWTKKT